MPCQDCQKENDHAYELAIDSRRTTEDQAMAILSHERRYCKKCLAKLLGVDAIGRRNAYDGTPWTHRT